jgi:hypothetical protein
MTANGTTVWQDAMLVYKECWLVRTSRVFLSVVHEILQKHLRVDRLRNKHDQLPAQESLFSDNAQEFLCNHQPVHEPPLLACLIKMKTEESHLAMEE